MPHFKQAAKERQTAGRREGGEVAGRGRPQQVPGIPARNLSSTGNRARDEAAKEVVLGGRSARGGVDAVPLPEGENDDASQL